MVRNVFHLDDRRLASLMVPRADIEWMQASNTVSQCLRQIGEAAALNIVHSWYPVCRNSLDDVVGVISVARLLQLDPNHQGSIEASVQPAVFVPETLTGMELLEQFRSHAGRLVFVVDEYGVVQGLMTPRDLLEAITGELQPRPAGPTPERPLRADGTWELDGLMPVSELRARLGDPLAAGGGTRPLQHAGGAFDVRCRGGCRWSASTSTAPAGPSRSLQLDGRRIDKVRAHPGERTHPSDT